MGCMGTTAVIRLSTKTLDVVRREADRNRRKIATQFDVIVEEWLRFRGLDGAPVAAEAASEGGDGA